MGVGADELRQLTSVGSLTVADGFAVTPAWQQAMDEDELEVLEDEVRELCGTAVVLVGDFAAEILPGDSGAVAVREPVSRRTLRAIFVRQVPEDEYSWFGPTELESALEFLGWHSN
jgi:hypothetical protein